MLDLDHFWSALF